ncbi:hypothetical protein AP071_07040 [Rhodobacter capsulatus]|nr:hypothetical protein AP071_07040 [Rhodobacter capsulatus]KQB16689.1 hypothetical protein AP073_10365 [Rhodobacter capsulatus]
MGAGHIGEAGHAPVDLCHERGGGAGGIGAKAAQVKRRAIEAGPRSPAGRGQGGVKGSGVNLAAEEIDSGGKGIPEGDPTICARGFPQS